MEMIIFFSYEFPHNNSRSKPACRRKHEIEWIHGSSKHRLISSKAKHEMNSTHGRLSKLENIFTYKRSLKFFNTSRHQLSNETRLFFYMKFHIFLFFFVFVYRWETIKKRERERNVHEERNCVFNITPGEILGSLTHSCVYVSSIYSEFSSTWLFVMLSWNYENCIQNTMLNCNLDKHKTLLFYW